VFFVYGGRLQSSRSRKTERATRGVRETQNYSLLKEVVPVLFYLSPALLEFPGEAYFQRLYIFHISEPSSLGCAT